MRKAFPFRSVCTFLLLSGTFAACKKDSGNVNTPVAPAGNPFVDTITVSSVNTPLDVFPTPHKYADVWMVALGTKIYFGNGSEAGNPVISRFFANYDVSTNTLTKGLPTTNSTCNCGANSRLLTDGNAIYSFANEAAKYSPVTNTWTVPAFPQSASDKMGESGTAVVGSKIYHLGGRSAGTTFIYYDAAVDNWFAAPDCPNAVSEPLLIAVDKKVYAFGGGTTRKPRTSLLFLIRKPIPGSPCRIYLSTTFFPEQATVQQPMANVFSFRIMILFGYTILPAVLSEAKPFL